MERHKQLQRQDKRGRWSCILTLSALLLFSSACVTLRDPETSQEFRTHVIANLPAGSSAAQTFISRRAGLNGIQLWLQPAPDQEIPPDAYLQLGLHLGGTESRPVFITRLSPQRIEKEYPVSVAIPSRQEKPEQEYTLFLEPKGFDLLVYGRDEDAYARGSFFLEGESIEGDLSFRTSYLYGLQAFFDDQSATIRNIWLVIPLLGVFWLPGRILLSAILIKGSPDQDLMRRDWLALDWGERTAFSLGLSLSLISVGIVWTTALGLKWTPLLAWIALCALLFLLAWQYKSWLLGIARHIRCIFSKKSRLQIGGIQAWLMRLDWTILALGIIFFMSASVRLAMVRDLAAPAWVDSVHHALIIRKILDLGMLPVNYLPYLESEYATYHSGFHAAAAFFLLLSGMPLPSGLLLFSQVLNALSVFPVYLFSTTITRSRLAGVFAALIAGLFTPMPAYYASWGRFTQLAGLLIMPVSLALFNFLSAWFQRSDRISPTRVFRPPAFTYLILLGISLAGLALTHYRVLAFLVIFIAVYAAASWAAAAWRKQLGVTAAIQVTVLSMCICLAVFFSLPWWPGVIQSQVYPRAEMVVTSLGNRTRLFDDFAWGYLNTALGKQAMVLAGLGWVLALIRRKSFPIILFFWVLLMFLFANPGAFGVPGLRILNNTSVEIILFMPFASLGGYLLAEIITFIESKLMGKLVWTFRLVVLVSAMLAAFHGARTLMPILNQGTLLVRQADLQSLQWMENNLPRGEKVVINSFLWGYNKLAGSDGGYWVSPLAGLQSLPPPVLHSLSNRPAIQKQEDQLAREAFDKSDKPFELKDFMVANQLRFIYIGVKGGVLSPRALIESQLFTPVYHNLGTWVLVLN